MKLLSPTLTLNDSSIRCRIGCSGLLLAVAIGGSALALLAMRRRSVGTVPAIEGQPSTEARLREVEGLREQGLISDAERDEARIRILNEI